MGERPRVERLILTHLVRVLCHREKRKMVGPPLAAPVTHYAELSPPSQEQLEMKLEEPLSITVTALVQEAAKSTGTTEGEMAASFLRDPYLLKPFVTIAWREACSDTHTFARSPTRFGFSLPDPTGLRGAMLNTWRRTTRQGDRGTRQSDRVRIRDECAEALHAVTLDEAFDPQHQGKTHSLDENKRKEMVKSLLESVVKEKSRSGSPTEPNFPAAREALDSISRYTPSLHTQWFRGRITSAAASGTGPTAAPTQREEKQTDDEKKIDNAIRKMFVRDYDPACQQLVEHHNEIVKRRTTGKPGGAHEDTWVFRDCKTCDPAYTLPEFREPGLDTHLAEDADRPGPSRACCNASETRRLLTLPRGNWTKADEALADGKNLCCDVRDRTSEGCSYFNSVTDLHSPKYAKRQLCATDYALSCATCAKDGELGDPESPVKVAGFENFRGFKPCTAAKGFKSPLALKQQMERGAAVAFMLGIPSYLYYKGHSSPLELARATVEEGLSKPTEAGFSKVIEGAGNLVQHAVDEGHVAAVAGAVGDKKSAEHDAQTVASNLKRAGTESYDTGKRFVSSVKAHFPRMRYHALNELPGKDYKRRLEAANPEGVPKSLRTLLAVRTIAANRTSHVEGPANPAGLASRLV